MGMIRCRERTFGNTVGSLFGRSMLMRTSSMLLPASPTNRGNLYVSVSFANLIKVSPPTRCLSALRCDFRALGGLLPLYRR
jgi:hypothetical protein